MSDTRTTAGGPGSDPELLPARMINEFVYCPRLFYLEYVDGEWAHNADTLEGRFVHRRVDTTSGNVPPADEIPDDARVHARSITLGSERLGATAVLDVIEGEGKCLVPIDYKKGAPPPVLDGVWEADAVQVCLQGLLLREHGYECDGGVVYYNATRKRVPVPFTDRLVERTLEVLEEARALASSGNVPPPLVNSSKCPRCSLVGICLPDETNLLSAPDLSESDEGEADQPAPLRRLIAANDDRHPLYVVEHGHRVGLDGGVLVVKKDDRKLDSIRLLDCSQVTLFGNAQISSQALREIVSRDMLITHLSYGGWLVAVTTPPPRKNIDLRRRQYAQAESPEARVRIARAMVAGKIANCRTLLRRNARDLPEPTLRQLKALRVKAEVAASIESLMGIEGSAARVYFEALPKAFRVDGESRVCAFDFMGRNRRPPKDPVNAMLSFMYALLVKDLVAAIVGVGFDPFLGFLHAPRYGRPALALDLMEEFRPLVGDSVVLGLINTREVAPSDFVERAGGCAMTDAGRRRAIEAYERRVQTEVTHPLFGYQVAYRRVFELQARLLARVLSGEVADYVAFRTR